MNASDYVPGDAIDSAELLDAVLKHEDALYVDGKWYDLSRPTLLELAAAMEAFDAGTHEFRRALVRCQQSAGEMRKEPTR